MEDEAAELAMAIELSMQEVINERVRAAAGGGGGDDGSPVEPAAKKQAGEPACRACEELGVSLRQAVPSNYAALAKDLGVLIKLLRNPAEKPKDAKFRKVKLTNKTIARVLANQGVREVLEACGFASGGSAEHLELAEEPSGPTAEILLRAADDVRVAQQMLQELHWLHTTHEAVPELSAKPWVADQAAKLCVRTCLGALKVPDEDLGGPAKTPWVERLHHILSSPEMRESRAAVEEKKAVAVPAVREVVLSLIREGGHDLHTLVLANKCFALLWPPGEKRTLDGRLDFCYACLDAALPEDDELMELKLTLEKDDMLGSAIRELGSFSEMGVRCGVLRQELTIEYEGESGEDAGGLRRQFFDRFTTELIASPFWSQTATGSLRPADSTALPGSQGGEGPLRQNMETCGRVCGMALYQELHRRLGQRERPDIYSNQPPNLFGDAFAKYFIRVVQHNPPASLPELQAELGAESLESDPDFRAGEAILSNSLEESGLEDETFVRAVGDSEIELVEGGASLSVLEENKHDWLQRLLRSELVDGYSGSAAHFRKGFVDVVGMRDIDASDPEMSRWTTPHFFVLTAEELQLQWSGAPVNRACIDELRRIAMVHPEVREQARWLWDILYSLDDEKRAKYYRFVTGSSRRPASGFSDFKIGPKEGGDGAYPFAHTCFNALDMPSYSSLPKLLERLEVAVEAAHDKFTDL